jgi:hypothetical protein
VRKNLNREKRHPIFVMRTPVLPKTAHRNSYKAIPGSPSKHFDERLIAIEEILGDELHWGSCGSVVEAGDDYIGWFVKAEPVGNC